MDRIIHAKRVVFFTDEEIDVLKEILELSEEALLDGESYGEITRQSFDIHNNIRRAVGLTALTPDDEEDDEDEDEDEDEDDDEQLGEDDEVFET